MSLYVTGKVVQLQIHKMKKEEVKKNMTWQLVYKEFTWQLGIHVNRPFKWDILLLLYFE